MCLSFGRTRIGIGNVAVGIPLQPLLLLLRCVLLQPVSLLLEHAGGVYAISKVSSGAIFSCSNDFTVRQVRSHRMRAEPSQAKPSQAKPQHAVRTAPTACSRRSGHGLVSITVRPTQSAQL